MKKLFTLMALLTLGVGSTFAENITATVKATYVDGSNTTTSNGEQTDCLAGYNKISGGSVALGNSGWGCNWITYLQVDATAVPLNATITKATLTASVSGSTDSKRTTAWGVGYNTSTWSSDLTWDTADRTITTIGATASSTSKAVGTFNTVTFDITDALKNDADKIATILVYETNAAGGHIKDMSVSVEYSTSAQADYTVKYVDANGTELKTSSTLSGSVGSVPTLTDVEKASFWNGIKYAYVSDDAASKTIAADGSTVVTIVFAEPSYYICSVKDNLGNTLEDNTKVYDGDNFIFYVPLYVFADNKFYTTPKLSAGTLSYEQATMTPTENTEITVTYTEEENTNVVYYSEAENISNITSYEDTFTNIRMSNGKAGYAAEAGTVITNLPAGLYTITAATRIGTTTFSAGENTILTMTSSGSIVTPTSDVFTLTEATDITVSAGSSKAYFDYVIIRKVTPATMAITDAGYATFCAPFDVTIPEGVTASKVTGVEENGATLTTEAVETTIPANTPVLVQSSTKVEQTFYGKPVEGTPIAGIMIGVTTEDGATITDGYVLQNQNNLVAFYKVTSEITVPANRCYLVPDEESPETKVLYFDNNGVETAISSINANSKENTAIYNLAGQRVNKAQKGIFIINGKKILK